MLYVISYDLTGENRHADYDAIADALERTGAVRVLFSQWALKSSITNVDRLKSMMLRLASSRCWPASCAPPASATSTCRH